MERPRPPTDAQLIRQFTAEEYGYYRLLERIDSQNLDGDDRVSAVIEEFPDGQGLNEFLQWLDRWEQRHHVRLRHPMSVDEFIGEIERTNFTEVNSMDLLLGTMERRITPFIYLGESTFGGPKMSYGISPTAFRLWPNINSSHRQPRVLDTNIMAINLDVPVDREGTIGPCMHRDSSGEVAIRSAAVTDLDRIVGFAFAQLGPLRVLKGEPEALAGMDMTQMGEDWFDTDFVAVVKVSRFGQAQSVWVIYNFFEDADDQFAPEEMKRIKTHDAYGRPLPLFGRLHEDCDQTFTVAKIADSLEELKYSRDLFEFQAKYRTERQIVKAKLFAGSAHRTMIGPRYIACSSEVDTPETSD